MARVRTNGTEHRLLDLLDAAYTPVPDETEWLESILEASLPLVDRGLGASVWTCDVGSPAIAGTMVSRGHDARALWSQCIESAGIETVRSAFKLGVLANVAYAGNAELRTAGRLAHDACGVGSFTSLVALDGMGWALAMTVPSAPGQRAFWPTGAARAMWERVGGHLSAAWRLRRTLAGRSTEAAAEIVFGPQGKVLHRAEGLEARSLERAQTAVQQRIDRRGGDPDAEVRARTALEATRWSVVTHAERTYAVANPSSVRARAPLSHRETQAADLAAAGHSNKQIAYELGISYGSVVILLRRAAKKLGLAERAELVAHVRAHPAG